MSMHQIEDMIEFSVLSLSHGAKDEVNGVPVRDICYNLYQLQDQFDCGYTVLRAPDELERMGFLVRIPVEKLPEKTRGAAARLMEEGGFLSSGAYVDEESGLVCITYGSELWNELIETGNLLQPKAGVIPQLDALELAKLLFPLAARQIGSASDQSKVAAGVLLYWYAFFPILMQACGYNEDSDVDAGLIRNLRDMAAIPAAFRQAKELWLETELDDLKWLAEDMELPYLEDWAEPYLQWKEKEGKDGGGEASSQHPDQKELISLLGQGEFARVDQLARDFPEPARSLYRINAALAFHAMGKENRESPAQAENLMTLPEIRDALSSLIEDDFHVSVKSQLRMLLSQSLFLMEEWQAGVDSLRDGFAPAVEELNRRENSDERRLLKAKLTEAYYETLLFGLPGNILNSNSLFYIAPTGMMPPDEAARILESEAETGDYPSELCCNIAILLLAGQKPAEAKPWLDRVLKNDPNSHEARAAMHVMDKIYGQG